MFILRQRARNLSSEAGLCGADEAGRGPVIGPMVVAAVKVESDDFLREIGVRDSKKCTPRRRERLARLIKERAEYAVNIISSGDIDRMRAEMTINEIEVEAFTEVLKGLCTEECEIYLDAADVNEERFGTDIGELLGFRPKRIIAEHGADDRYPVVSAASIIAKVTRDSEIEKIKEELGDIGSGYPADPITKEFLRSWVKAHGDLPPHTRRSWKTAKKALESANMRTLEDFMR